jgi:DNA-binding NarL/FixJ family response regulator
MTEHPERRRGAVPGPIRVLVVDDHPAVRTALAARLSDEDDLTVVGECEDGSQVAEAAARLRPDVVCMDLSMPVMDGLAATEALRDAQRDARVVMLTADGAAARESAEAAGARALVPKGTPSERLLQCLRTVALDGDGCPFCF